MALGLANHSNVSITMTQQGSSVIITYTILGNYVSVVSNTNFVTTFHSYLMQQTGLAGYLNITSQGIYFVLLDINFRVYFSIVYNYSNIYYAFYSFYPR